MAETGEGSRIIEFDVVREEILQLYRLALQKAEEPAFHTEDHINSILNALEDQRSNKWGMDLALERLVEENSRYGELTLAEAWEVVKLAVLCHDLGDIAELTEGGKIVIFEEPFTGSQGGKAEARAIKIAEHYAQQLGWSKNKIGLLRDWVAATLFQQGELPKGVEELEIKIDNEIRRIDREFVRWVQINDQIHSYLFPPDNFLVGTDQERRIRCWRIRQLAGLIREFNRYFPEADWEYFVNFVAYRFKELWSDFDQLTSLLDRLGVAGLFEDWFQSSGAQSFGGPEFPVEIKTVRDLIDQAGKDWLSRLREIYLSPPDSLEELVAQLIGNEDSSGSG